jgi:predicted DNA-binding transcriptional regulator AlpA
MATASAAQAARIQPRIIRAGDAPQYLGMCRAEFNKTVRPYVSEFPIGERGIGFDREELDAWVNDYIQAMAIAKSGSKGRKSTGSEPPSGGSGWREKQSQAFPKGTVSGTSTRGSTAKDFTKALELVTGRKQKST